MSATNAYRFLDEIRRRGGRWQAGRGQIASTLGLTRNQARTAVGKAQSLGLVRAIQGESPVVYVEIRNPR